MKSKNKYAHLAGLPKGLAQRVSAGLVPAPQVQPDREPLVRRPKKRRLKAKVAEAPDTSTTKSPKEKKEKLGKGGEKKKKLPKESESEKAPSKKRVKIAKDAAPSSLHSKMKQQLASSRFRFLNEQLYTKSGAEAGELFRADPGAFSVYHEGYRAQMDKWPLKPIQWVINLITRRFGGTRKAIADLGCGEAVLAATLGHRHTIHSFDFIALNDKVTKADMANPASVDVAVFCLSLMGTNAGEYVREANRILRPNGTLLIAEIASRFASANAFRKTLEGYGFRQEKKTTPNDYFTAFEFIKSGKSKKNALPIVLQPCVYKKR